MRTVVLGCVIAAAAVLAGCDVASQQPIDDSSYISREDALERALEEEGQGLEATSVDARLDWYQAHKKEDKVRAWIVTYGGVQIPVEGPAPEDGKAAPQQCFTDWEVALDATTGEFLVAGSSSSTRCD